MSSKYRSWHDSSLSTLLVNSIYPLYKKYKVQFKPCPVLDLETSKRELCNFMSLSAFPELMLADSATATLIIDQTFSKYSAGKTVCILNFRCSCNKFYFIFLGLLPFFLVSAILISNCAVSQQLRNFSVFTHLLLLLCTRYMN